MNQESTLLRKNLKLALLAGTCLGTGASLSNAATVIESGDFSNTLIGALASPLPFGTDQVQGTIDFSDIDFVTFTSLLPGSPFSIGYSDSIGASLFVLDSTGNFAAVNPAGPSPFTGTVPSDGRLVGQIQITEGGTGAYTINLTATTVPEPNAAVLAALGVSAAALRRSRREKKTS